MRRAVFFDRDGVVNEFVYYPEIEAVGVPNSASQVKLVFGVVRLIKAVREMGFKVIIISNQPDVALGKISIKTLAGITKRIKELLAEEGAEIDAVYYCTHHPFAVDKILRKCACRKPQIGLLKRAERELGVDLKKSWVIGDGVADIKAGFTAGCKTILRGLTDQTGFFSLIEKEFGKVKPDFVIKRLEEAIDIISADVQPK